MNRRRGERRALAERLRNYAVDSSSGCWNWLGHTNKGGYGRMLLGSRMDGTRRNDSVHRISFELFVRPLVGGEWVLHKCDNARCVNPDHLYAGTREDNIKDMVERGRRKGVGGRPGEKSPWAKLSERDAIYIRGSKEKQRVLAEKFGVSRVTVSDIKCGRTWKHLSINQQAG